jgi:DNA-binding transcriptional LysR family regulator
VNWDDIRTFDAVASARTLTAAARRLNVSVATISRRLDSLESGLGLRLVDRTPEGIRLTADGAALVDCVKSAASAVDGLRRRADALKAGDMRPIRVSATEPIAAELLAPALPDLIRRLPTIRVEIAVSAEVVSLASRGVDMALRLARPRGDSLLVQRLPPFNLGLYASRDYLGARRPDGLDLRASRLMTYDDTYGPIAEVAWVRDMGLADASRIRTSSTRALLTATLAGAGVGLLPEILARRYQTLVRIPTDIPIPERNIWLMSHKDLRRSPNHRIVRAWILRTLHDARTPEDGAAAVRGQRRG